MATESTDLGVFQLTETIIIQALNYSSGALTDPTTSYTITINDPAGVVAVNGSAMTKDSTGTFHYDYEPAATAMTGKHKGYTKMTSSTRDTLQPFHFEVEPADGV